MEQNLYNISAESYPCNDTYHSTPVSSLSPYDEEDTDWDDDDDDDDD